MCQSGSAMVSNLSSLFSAFISLLLAISAHGRSSFQKNSGEKFSSSIKVGVVSHATTYTGKTNFNDVRGLEILYTEYPSLLEDNGDPCFTPVWSWIECNSDPRPRVIALNLGTKLLLETGALPDFSVMDALQSIDLQRNNFLGTIPSFLGDFPKLQELNLANNFLTGLVPDSLACNTNLTLRLDGNLGLYTSNSCPLGRNSAVPTAKKTPTPDYSGDGYVYTTTSERKKSRVPVIVGSTVSIFAVVSVAVGIFAIFRHKANVAAAVAAANAQGPDNDEKLDHTGETPINPR